MHLIAGLCQPAAFFSKDTNILSKMHRSEMAHPYHAATPKISAHSATL
jgi:hypothetical protein